MSWSFFWLGHRDSNPGNDGVRVRCLTAWRCPNIFNALYYSRIFLRCQYLFSTFFKNLFSFQKKSAFLLYNARLLWYNTHYKLKFLPVAQLDSASDSDSEGQRFKSVRVGQNKSHPSWVVFVLLAPYGRLNFARTRFVEECTF